MPEIRGQRTGGRKRACVSERKVRDCSGSSCRMERKICDLHGGDATFNTVVRVSRLTRCASVNDISATASLLTYQLRFFIAAWSFFHWAEFAVTAGWNFEKCSVDCMPLSIVCHLTKLTPFQSAYILDNGSMYHIANGTALTEFLISRYFWPSSKSWPYVSLLGRADASLCRHVLK